VCVCNFASESVSEHLPTPLSHLHTHTQVPAAFEMQAKANEIGHVRNEVRDVAMQESRGQQAKDLTLIHDHMRQEAPMSISIHTSHQYTII